MRNDTGLQKEAVKPSKRGRGPPGLNLGIDKSPKAPEEGATRRRERGLGGSLQGQD